MRVIKTAVLVTTGVLAITVTAPSKGYTGLVVSATASWDSGAVGPFYGMVTWGDGGYEEIARQAGKSVTKTHAYTVSGTYTIKFVLADDTTFSTGNSTASITIAAQLTSSLSASPAGGIIPLAVTFAIGIGGGHTPYYWTLEYGDGTSSGTGAVAGTIAHTYTKVGSFNITLTVTDALGATIVRRLTTNIVGEDVLNKIVTSIKEHPIEYAVIVIGALFGWRALTQKKRSVRKG